MDALTRLRIIEKLQDLCVKVALLSKETSSTSVAGLELTREDLAGGRGKPTVHGQKHKQPTNTSKITPPAGMGICSDSPNVGSFYQAGPNAHS